MSLEDTDRWNLYIFEDGIQVSMIAIADRQSGVDYFSDYCSAHQGTFTGMICHVYYDEEDYCIKKEEEDIVA